MPYISRERRRLLEAGRLRAGLPTHRPNSVGELTFCLTRELDHYLKDKVERGSGIRYADAAECLAALEGARADFERRILTDLEIAAQARNGDVWSDEVLLAPRQRA